MLVTVAVVGDIPVVVLGPFPAAAPSVRACPVFWRAAPKRACLRRVSGPLLRVLGAYAGEQKRAGAAPWRLLPVNRCSSGGNAGEAAEPRHVPAVQLAAAKNIRPIRSVDEMASDVFGSDEELEEFLAFTYAERRRGLWSDAFHSDASSGADYDDRVDDS